MPVSALKIAVIPDAWKAAVIALLERGGKDDVLWTLRAQNDWQLLDDWGTKERAHEHIIARLKTPDILAHDHPPQQDALDCSSCETWAFLCPHPQGVTTPVYVKIGLHNNRLRINLISLHIDLTGELQAAIKRFLQK